MGVTCDMHYSYNQYIRVGLHLFLSPLFIVEYVKEVGKRGGISG
jgi:hypothetical protein